MKEKRFILLTLLQQTHAIIYYCVISALCIPTSDLHVEQSVKSTILGHGKTHHKKLPKIGVGDIDQSESPTPTNRCRGLRFWGCESTSHKEVPDALKRNSHNLM